MDLSIYENKMKERIDYLKEELSNVRAGRANPQILNKISVEYYGALTPLNQVASISVPEPRQILIAPWDRSLLNEIAKTFCFELLLGLCIIPDEPVAINKPPFTLNVES